MQINKVFLSVNARDFSGLSEWWSKALERRWDREPMPNCREWDVAGSVLFQVLDNPKESGWTVITLHIADLDRHIERLRSIGVEVDDAVHVEGFETLRIFSFTTWKGMKWACYRASSAVGRMSDVLVLSCRVWLSTHFGDGTVGRHCRTAVR